MSGMVVARTIGKCKRNVFKSSRKDSGTRDTVEIFEAIGAKISRKGGVDGEPSGHGRICRRGKYLRWQDFALDTGAALSEHSEFAKPVSVFSKILAP